MSKRLQDRILAIYRDSNQENQDEFMDKPSNFLGGNLNPELQARIREIYNASNNEDLTQFTDKPSTFLGGSIQERMKQIYSEQINEGGQIELIDSVQKDLRKMKSDIKKGKGINRTTKALSEKAKAISKKAKSIDDSYKLSTIANRALMAFPEKREKLEKSSLGKNAVEYVQRRAQQQKPIKQKLKDLEKMVKQKREEQLFTDNPETEQSFIDNQNEQLNSEIETYYDDQGIPYYYDPVTQQTYYGDGFRRVGRPCKKIGGEVKRSRLNDIKSEQLTPYFEQPLFDSAKERLYREKKILDNERRKLDRDKLKMEQEKEKSKLGEEIKRQKIQLGLIKKQQTELRKKVTKEAEKQNLTKTEEKEAIRRDKELNKQKQEREKEIEKLNKAKANTSKVRVSIKPTSKRPSNVKYSQGDVTTFFKPSIDTDYEDIVIGEPLNIMNPFNEPKQPLSLIPPKQPLEINEPEKKDVKQKIISFENIITEKEKKKSKPKEKWDPDMTISFANGFAKKPKQKRRNANAPQKGSQEAKEKMAYLRSFKKN